MLFGESLLSAAPRVPSPGAVLSVPPRHEGVNCGCQPWESLPADSLPHT